MRKLILATAMAAVAVPIAASPADAQGRNERREARECRQELRNADSRREYRQRAARVRTRAEPGPRPRLADLQPLRL